jgi:hypothetical protein
MSLNLFMDVHIDRAITVELRKRGADVLTAQEDGSGTLADPALLDRATGLGRVLFTHDPDLLAEAHRRQRASESFAGLTYVRFRRLSIGQIVSDLEVLAMASDPVDMVNRVVFLPL